KYNPSASSTSGCTATDCRYFFPTQSSLSASIRYFGVRVHSLSLLKSASNTARVLLMDSPMPTDIRNGTYLRRARQSGWVSRCQTKQKLENQKGRAADTRT